MGLTTAQAIAIYCDLESEGNHAGLLGTKLSEIIRNGDSLREQFTADLSAIPMASIIDWYQWEDSNGEFEDITFSDAVDIAVYWFTSVEEMGESRFAYLAAE